MTMIRLAGEQYRRMPLLAEEGTFAGKTYVITGGNSGLGLETAKHLVEFSATRVVLAVRNLKAGENAKKEIERLTGRQGVVQVMHIDMASTSSIQSFVKQASAELDRIDGFVANAGIMVDAWSTIEGMESSIYVNVVNTIFLASLIMPKLSESARKTQSHPTLVFIVSVLGYTAKGEMDKSRQGSVLEGLNDEKRASMSQRYALTKLVEEFAARQLAAECPLDRTGVVINFVAPGLCSTALGKDAGTMTKIMHTTVKTLMARSPEAGSRTIIHGLIAGDESHGKMLSGCKIKEYWVPDWMKNAEGQRLQKKLWSELTTSLETVQPGCMSQLSQL